MNRYYKLDGLSTILKLEVMPDRARIYRWDNGSWVPTGNKYVGIFVGKIETEEIRKGDKLWDPRFEEE